jgi:site-specific recombinase XerD
MDTKLSTAVTTHQAIERFLQTTLGVRSLNTAKTYQFALLAYERMLEQHSIRAAEYPITQISEDSMAWFADYLKDLSPRTEQLYLAALMVFFEFIVAENLSNPNLPRLRLLLRQRSRRIGFRLPQFPKEEILAVLQYMQNIYNISTNSAQDNLRTLRDRAFLLVLADTGLRVHEACNLLRGDIDWMEGRAIIVGKGGKEAVIRFSTRSLSALRDYLAARSSIDGQTGRPIGSLALFARHDKGAGKKIKKITTATGRNIVAQRVSEALGSDAAERITPHSFRHYFVTTVLNATGNLKLAQELARHSNIQVTQRYAHLNNDELDRGYHQIFEEESTAQG